MMNNILNIATLNINGMKAFTTQSALLQIIACYKFDILFLQETHVDSLSLGNSIKKEIGL